MQTAKQILERHSGASGRTRISVAISQENRDWITDLGRKTGLTPSNIVNTALDSFFEGYEVSEQDEIDELDELLGMEDEADETVG